MCNYHVYTKSHVSDFPQNKKQPITPKRSYTLNIRHGLKINILVNKYSENIFPFMKRVAIQVQKYTDGFLAFYNICNDNDGKIIIFLKKIKNINFVHILIFLSARNDNPKKLNSDLSTPKCYICSRYRNLYAKGKIRFSLDYSTGLHINRVILGGLPLSRE